MIESDDAESRQLELFGEHLPLIALPPCGRGRGRCLAYIELGPHGEQLHCIRCDGVAPQSDSCISRITAGRFRQTRAG
jgi:hypothetical protein